VQYGIDTGELAPDTDPALLAFSMLGLILVFHRAETSLGLEEAGRRARQAFEKLLAQHAAPGAAPSNT
jgi:hypothetical protein